MPEKAPKISPHLPVQKKQQELQSSFIQKKGEQGFFCPQQPHASLVAPAFIQPKLQMSQPGDPYEKEADAMADKVMRMNEPAAVTLASATNPTDENIQRKEKEEEETVQAKLYVNHGGALVQRMEAGEEVQCKEQDEENVQRKEEDEEKVQPSVFRKEATVQYHEQDDNIQAKASYLARKERGPPTVHTQFENNLQSNKTGGSSMDAGTKEFMESRFSADFSGVRIHTGSSAVAMSSSINAQAFAHGNNIYFNQGKYNPGTGAGKHLLAHELTHTIQQGAAKSVQPFLSTKLNTQAFSDGIPAVAPSKFRVQRDATTEQIMPRKNSTITKDLSNSFSNVSRKEAVNTSDELSEKTEPTVSARPELSSWNVSGNGVLHTKPVQLKQELDDLQKKEEKEEEEKKGSSGLMALQKKAGNNCGVENDCIASPLQEAATYLNCKKNDTQYTATNVPGNNGNAIDMCADTYSRGPPVQLQTTGEMVQCGWFDTALSYVNTAYDFVAEGLEAGKRMLLGQARDFVMAIPGYRALRVVLGEDPITGEEIERNGHNFIEAAFDIMPGGRLLHEKLTELGALDEAAQWIDTGMATVQNLVGNIVTQVANFWNGLSLESLASPTDIFESVGNIIHNTISSIVDFAVSAATQLLEIVKHWLLTQVVGFIQARTTAYPLLCVILGSDPITGQEVLRNGTTILNAILELGGDEGRQQRTQMQETGTFQKAADWIDRGILVFGNLLQTITNNFGLIWSVVSIDALMHPIDKFTEIYNVFATPVTDVLRFMADTATIILQFIKEVLLQRLSAWARTVRGYFLVTVIIGKDPFTDRVVERNVENTIHGFMSLMEGGEEQFNQMKETGSIDRATLRIDAAVARLNMTPAAIVQLFVGLWNSFSINDLADPIAAFQRIIETFGEPIGRLIAFVVEIVKIVVVVILEIMNFPFDLINNIIARTIAAFQRIKNDPIGFLKNLLRAIKQGFIQFFDNIVTHLINGVVGWLMSELRDAGIPELTDFSLRGVIGWVLGVLGLSMDAIWAKLAAHPRIGPARVTRLRSMIDTLEGIWTFIRDVQERGIAAIWEKIQEQLTNLWNTVIDAVKNWVMERIVTQVTARLLSMLDPTGIMAVVNSCIAIYSAIQSFIRYLREMLEIINSFVNGVAEIAEGNISTAANYLERTMGRAMPVVIGFLANQVGLSGIGRRIGEMIIRVREMVDDALTWLVNRAVDTGMALLDRAMALGRTAVGAVRDAGRRVVGAVAGWLGLRQEFTSDEGEQHHLYFRGSEGSAELIIASEPQPLELFLRSLEIAATDPQAGYKQHHKDAAIVKATEIARLKAMPVAGADDVATRQNQLAKDRAIATLLQEISENTKHLFGANLPEAGEPEHNPASDSDTGFGHYMRIKPLTRRLTVHAGTEPTDESHSVYRHLARRRGGGSTYYKKGHLLNQGLKGVGTWKNLTPLTTAANGEHERTVESYVKAAVDTGAIVEYRVVANYTSSRGDKNALLAQNPSQEVRDIIIAEDKVPLGITCEAYRLDSRLNRVQTIVNVGIANTISRNIVDYDLTGGSVPDIYLSDKQAPQIATALRRNSFDEDYIPLITRKIIQAYNVTPRIPDYQSLANRLDFTQDRADVHNPADLPALETEISIIKNKVRADLQNDSHVKLFRR